MTAENTTLLKAFQKTRIATTQQILEEHDFGCVAVSFDEALGALLATARILNMSRSDFIDYVIKAHDEMNYLKSGFKP